MIMVKRADISIRMVRHGYTQAGLARATGISVGYIGQILGNRRGIRPPTAKRICDALDCNFDDIFLILEEEKKDGK